MNFNFQGKDTLVEYSYPWLPNKCTYCGKWGHLARVCRGKKIADETMEEEELVKTSRGIDSVKGSVEVVKTVSSEGRDVPVDVAGAVDSVMGSEKEKVIGVAGKQVDKLAGSVEREKGSCGKDNTKTHRIDKEKVWMEISRKVSRTPIKSKQLEFEQVSILSKSRFSRSGTDEEEGEIPETKDDNGGRK
ncbi:hypothetical protein Bca52824_071222 [Brassica carinata]|uniref:CCHC-type domain-containing protein n=1 Tax=Brassica carinata TaxID=52824 RepID=A0A8X7Q6R9_BRACI|nr:hypothetical protein Bca52824_071222 [Brassica carinata]